MKYPVTLTRGARIVRDPNLTIRMTRAPDAVVQTITETVTITETTVFIDRYNGTGALDAHTPDVGGGPYTQGADIPPSSMMLDGAGGLLIGDYGSPVSAFVTSAIDVDGADKFTVESKATITATDDACAAQIGTGVSDGASGIVAMYLIWSAGVWTLELSITLADGSPAYETSIDVTALMATINVERTLRFEVGATGSVVKFDGATVATTAAVPDWTPTSAFVDANNMDGGNTTTGTLNNLKVLTTA